MSAKAGLKANKAVYVSIAKGDIDKNEIKRHLRTVEKCINQLCRDMAFAEERHKVELLLLKSEATRDAIDVEAHGARVAERLRFLLQRQAEDVTVVDRAKSNTKFVESALATLDPHTQLNAVGLKNVKACAQDSQASAR